MTFSFHPLEFSKPAVTYFCLGIFTVLYTVALKFTREKLFLGEALPATIFGIILGPYGANVLDPRAIADSESRTNVITIEIMRLTLATGLFAIGTELPKRYLAEKWKSLSIMVIPTMAFGWVISAAFVFLLFPGLSFVSCLCISACLTPTDPILSVAIISGEYATKNVAEDLRNLIAAESAANDGLAYPFLSLSIYLLRDSWSGKAIAEWSLVGILYQVVLGVIVGALLGYIFRHILKYCLQMNLLDDRETHVAQYVTLVLFCVGVICIVGSDDLLAVFAAGSAIGWDGHFKEQVKNESFSKVLELLLNCAAFTYIGTWLPFKMYNAPQLGITPWRLIVLLVIILALRRIPFLLAVSNWVPEIGGWKGALFAGHFGPMGVGAIFISMLAAIRIDDPHIPSDNERQRLAACLHPIVSFVVLGSIIVHGLSIPLSQLGIKIVDRTQSRWESSAPLFFHKAKETGLEEAVPVVDTTGTGDMSIGGWGAVDENTQRQGETYGVSCFESVAVIIKLSPAWPKKRQPQN